MFYRIPATLFLLLLSLGATGIRSAVADSPVAADLISETSAVAGGDRFYVGVRFEIDPHWHIYWKNPGSSGYGIAVDWDLPAGVRAGALEWPVPERFEFDGFINYGYSGRVTLLVPIEVDASLSGELDLKATVSWLACENACIPGSAELQLRLPRSDASEPDPAQEAVFEDARAALPEVWRGGPLVYEVGKGGIRIQIPDTEIKEAYFYAEAFGWVDADAAQVLTQESGMGVLTVPVLEGELPPLLAGVLELDGQAWEVELASAVAAPEMQVYASGWEGKLLQWGLGGWLLLAFLGGVILNIMPCVLPVLSLKVFSLLKHAGQTRGQAFAYGLAYTLGVVLSFVVLAAALFALRGLGERIGWGFQLQNPAFVVTLTLLLFVFALNLIGVFEMGVGLVGADSKVARRKDLLGSFGTGILAAVVGAPCVGPLLGGVSGLALQADPLVGISVFAMLGFGMAFPFLLLSIFPKLAAYLPKPGVWMETFKQAMGFLLFAVVVFLLWVVGQSGGVEGMMALLLALLLAALAAWIYGRWAAVSKPSQTRRRASLLALLLLGLSLWGGARFVGQSYAANQGGVSERSAEAFWQPWSKERVASELAAGRSVFVDFTASWCLTCQVNKRTTLRTAGIRELFEAHSIVPLEADWSLSDPAITDALESYGRSGVPLYLLHTSDGKTEILPQNLTPAIVRQAVESAH